MMRRRRTLLTGTLFLTAVSAGALLIPSCATMPELPPISTTEQRLPGKIVWHDLLTSDLEATSRFYSELFGWRFEHLTNSYGQFKNDRQVVAGVAEVNTKELGAYWVPLMSVADVDRSSTQIQALGGKVVKDPFDIPGRGRVAVVRDPQNAAFAIIRALRGDPGDREAAIGEWLWDEVWTDHPDDALTFYKTLGGYQEAMRELAGRKYRFLKSENRARMGLPQKPDPKVKNTWACYIRVADPAATAKRAIELGGKVLLAPRADIRNGTVAILADPDGGAFLVQKWPIE